MKSRGLLLAHVLAAPALSLVGCAARQQPLTVSQVWQDAESLEGQRIRVRGLADFRLTPYHPLQVGGCIPSVEGETRPRIVGELAIRDEQSNDPKSALLISESSLHCEGEVCSIVCTPFAPSAQAIWGGTETIDAFEFVGTLRARVLEDGVTLILDDIDLGASRRRVDGKWESIPTGDFTYAFP